MRFWQKLKEKWRIANEKHDKKWKDIDRYLAGDKTIKIPKFEKFILVTLPEILEKIFPKLLWGMCVVLAVVAIVLITAYGVLIGIFWVIGVFIVAVTLGVFISR